MDKREAAYTQARIDLLHEMLKAGAFDMPTDERKDFVHSTIRQIVRAYPDLDEPMIGHLFSDGMNATYGDANLAEAALHGRGEMA